MFILRWQAQHFRCVVLRVFPNLIVRAASSGDNVQIVWQVWDRVGYRGSVLLHGRRSVWCRSVVSGISLASQAQYLVFRTLYTLHFTTLNFALRTLHFTLHTFFLPRLALYTLLSTLYTLHSTL